MAIPRFSAFMLPLLELLQDRAEHSFREVTDALAEHFGLTDDDRNELLPSGQQSRLTSRVSWARTYLLKAGLLESTGRAKFRITDRGVQVLRDRPSEITPKYLQRFPEFLEFHPTRRNDGEPEAEIPDNEQTPEETLELAYQSLRRELSSELLRRVKTCSPKFFETLVIDLLLAMGYGGSRQDAGQAVGQSGDGGIDGVIKEDRLGLDIMYIQAKRWDSVVGSPVVQAFTGSLEGQRARKGVLITTSSFSTAAREYVNKIEKKIVLIDGEQLAEYMIDYGIGVTQVATYVVKKVDTDYFADEG